jgi:hypothetical protein
MMYEPVDTHEADVFVAQLWRDIYNRVRALLHPHHREHEPGGLDQVKIPLGALADTVLTDPQVGDTLTYNGITWVNATPVPGEFIAGEYLGDLIGAHVGFFTRLADDGVSSRFVFEATDHENVPKFSVMVDENGSVYVNGVPVT